MHSLGKAVIRLNKIEELANQDSCIHRLSAAAKLLVTFCFLMTVISFDTYELSGLVQFALYPVLLIVLADIPLGIILPAILVALPFTLCAGLSNIFFNQQVFSLVAGFPVTYGLISCLSLVFKCILTVSAVVILISTTKLLDLCKALGAFGMPNLFIVQFLLCFRYISLLLEEAGQMFLAYQLRNPRQRGIQFRHTGEFIGQLLLRSHYRAEKVYTAMQCRGFQQFLVKRESVGMDARSLRYAVLVCAAILGARFVNGALLWSCFFY